MSYCMFRFERFVRVCEAHLRRTVSLLEMFFLQNNNHVSTMTS